MDTTMVAKGLTVFSKIGNPHKSKPIHYHRVIIEPVLEGKNIHFEAFCPTLGRATCTAVGSTEIEALYNLISAREKLLADNEDPEQGNLNEEVGGFYD